MLFAENVTLLEVLLVVLTAFAKAFPALFFATANPTELPLYCVRTVDVPLVVGIVYVLPRIKNAPTGVLPKSCEIDRLLAPDDGVFEPVSTLYPALAAPVTLPLPL